MTGRMSEAQRAALRDLSLTLVSTLLDGTLVVREPAGGLLELKTDGDLTGHTERTGRVDARELLGP